MRALTPPMRNAKTETTTQIMVTTAPITVPMIHLVSLLTLLLHSEACRLASNLQSRGLAGMWRPRRDFASAAGGLRGASQPGFLSAR